MRRSRLSIRDHRLAVKGQLEALGIMSGKPAPEYTTRIPEKRGPRKVQCGGEGGTEPGCIPAKATQLPPRRSTKKLEWQVLREVMKALRSHPNVWFCMRMQSGIFQQEDRTVRVGSVGLPDIVGMLRGGQLFAVECKSETGRLSDSQDSWLEKIRLGGGRAGVARCADDALKIIEGHFHDQPSPLPAERAKPSQGRPHD